MRIVMFYSGVESFNYFTGEIDKELKRRGNETYILDLTDMKGHTGCDLSGLSAFIEGGVDMVISYDGFGMKEDMFIELWDSCKALCVNILMDHPLRFHETMTKHPASYVQYCCDRGHVEYVKKYFSDTVKEVYFLPHAGTVTGEQDLDRQEYVERHMDVLFSGTYYDPSKTLDRVNEWFEKDSMMDLFYRELYDLMCNESELSTDAAVEKLLDIKQMSFTPEKKRTVFRCAEPVDWAVRMHYRGMVIEEIARSGIDIHLLGRGWEDHPSVTLPNFHIVSDRIAFAETFKYMRKAKININVMPLFKAGSHDRIFNIYLSGSLPFTDTSSFLDEAYGYELPRYKLDEIGKIPSQLKKLLSDPDGAIKKINTGYEKTNASYTWSDLVDKVMEVRG